MISFVGSATLAVDATLATVDISGIGIEPGDLAVALIAYGAVDAIPETPPDEWVRVGGVQILEDVELAGEAVARFLVGDEEEFSFTASVGSPMAIYVSVWRGVRGIDAIDAFAQTIGTSAAFAHATPGVRVLAADAQVLSAYFFWFSPGLVTVDAATTNRGGITSPGSSPDRSVAVRMADEAATAGAVPGRTATTFLNGYSNRLSIALTAATGERNAFEIQHGAEQGRVTSDPVQGEASFVLGCLEGGREVDIAAGDYVEIFQTGTIEGDIFRCRARLRAAPDAGISWRIVLLIDGIERASRNITIDETIELAANLSGVAPGDYEIRFRLEAS